MRRCASGPRRRCGRVRPARERGSRSAKAGGWLGDGRRTRSFSRQAAPSPASKTWTRTTRRSRCRATTSIRPRSIASARPASSRSSPSSAARGRPAGRRSAGLRLRRLRRGLHPHELARDHDRGRGRGRRDRRRRPRRVYVEFRDGDRVPARDRRLRPLRRRRRPQGRPRRPRAQAGAARRLEPGRRRRARCGDREPVRAGELPRASASSSATERSIDSLTSSY